MARALAGADGVTGIVTADGTTPAWRPGTFDRVLVDAPCSGLGALRRRPESRWRRQPGDVADLVPLQRSLLTLGPRQRAPRRRRALRDLLARSLAETVGVLEAVLAERPDARLEPVPLDLPDAEGPLPGRSSSGRTGTPPTRCSWGWCDGCDRWVDGCLKTR